MAKVYAVSRYLMGVLLVAFGLNGLLQFIAGTYSSTLLNHVDGLIQVFLQIVADRFLK